MSSLLDFYDPYLYDLGAGDTDSGDTFDYYRGKIGPAPLRILDIGAGSGRIAIPLIALGHDVIAIDRSARMIDWLDQRVRLAAPTTGKLGVVCGPFGKRSSEEPVDVAIAPDDFVLHLLSPNELTLFFQDLTSWLRVGGRFLTDVRPREQADLQTATRPPYVVRSFSLVQDESGQGEVTHVHVAFWEAYDDKTRLLETTCQYQMLNALGDVIRSYFRVLRQRMHTNAEIRRAAEEAGFRLVEHTERNRAQVPSALEIGGSFEFRL